MKRMGRFGLSLALILATFSLVSAPPVAQAAVGDVDTAMVFDGNNQMASSTSFPANTGDSTIEMWVYQTSSCAAGRYYLYSQGYYQFICGAGFWKFALFNGAWTETSYSNEVINQWAHIAFTRTSAGAPKLYVNGNLVLTASSPTSVSSNSGAIQIGGVGSNYYPVRIDEIKIWNVVRTQANILTDMHTYNPTTTGLLGYYDFNESSGTAFNKIPSPASGSDISALSNSPTRVSIESYDTSINPGSTVVRFPRTYLTANGGWKIPANISSIKSLIVAGGGGGGGYYYAGGGGSGGVIYDSSYSVSTGNPIAITVGVGGNPGPNDGTADNARGGLGTDSWIGNSTFAAKGGGGGAGYGYSKIAAYATGSSGGSSGGGSENSTGVIASPAISQTLPSGADNAYGNVGGTVQISASQAGSGGGGAGAVGGDAASFRSAGAGGAGINTYSYLIAGVAGCIAGGGGGGNGNGVATSATCGGGAGGSSGAGADATANTGGGGGGASLNSTGGRGGSGIVLISYQNSFGASVSISANPKKSTKASGATQITATTTSTGTVTFYANGRIINGCKNVVVSGTTATCNWRPMTQGPVALSAAYTSNDSLYSGTVSSAAITTAVSKRTTAR